MVVDRVRHNIASRPGSRRSPGLVTRGARDEQGQSVIEFVLMLPMMLGLAMMMIKVNTVIQMSIVNQQYSRAQATWLAFNSPNYPQLRLIQEGGFLDAGYNQMIIGMSDDKAPEDGGGTYKPSAQHGYIARKKGVGDNSPGEVSSRADVRVRTTVTLCTQANIINSNGKPGPIVKLAGGGLHWDAAGTTNLSGGTTKYPFAICKGPTQ